MLHTTHSSSQPCPPTNSSMANPSANPYSLPKDPLSIPRPRLPSLAPMSALLRALTTSLFFFFNWLFCFVPKMEYFSPPSSQVVFFLFWVCRIFENEFFKQDWRSRRMVQIFQYIFMKWLLCFLIGLIVSLVGFCNNLAVENLAGIKFVITSNMMLERR